MSPPSDRNSHIGKGHLGKFVEQGKKARAPLCGRGDFSEPGMADGQNQPNAVMIECWSGMPLRVFVLAREARLDAEDAVPNPRMVSAGVSDGEDRLDPGEKKRIGVAEIRRDLLLNGRSGGRDELQNAAATHQLTGHPQRQ